MSFKNQQNKRDGWMHFAEQHSCLLDEAGLSNDILDNESKFEQLLTAGSIQGCNVSLAQISDDQFLALETVVNAFYQDGWQQKALTEFSKQRLKRFRRHASSQANPVPSASPRLCERSQ